HSRRDRQVAPESLGSTPRTLATRLSMTHSGRAGVLRHGPVDGLEVIQGMQDWKNLYTGRPSRTHNVVAFGATTLQAALRPVGGGVLAVVPYKIPLLTDGVPPFFVKRGLDVTHTEFDRMPVLAFAPAEPTDKIVVAIHGGAYVGEATVFH